MDWTVRYHKFTYYMAILLFGLKLAHASNDTNLDQFNITGAIACLIANGYHAVANGTNIYIMYKIHNESDCDDDKDAGVLGGIDAQAAATVVVPLAIVAGTWVVNTFLPWVKSKWNNDGIVDGTRGALRLRHQPPGFNNNLPELLPDELKTDLKRAVDIMDYHCERTDHTAEAGTYRYIFGDRTYTWQFNGQELDEFAAHDNGQKLLDGLMDKSLNKKDYVRIELLALAEKWIKKPDNDIYLEKTNVGRKYHIRGGLTLEVDETYLYRPGVAAGGLENAVEDDV